MLPDCRLTTADSENPSLQSDNNLSIFQSTNLPIPRPSASYEGSCTSSSATACSVVSAAGELTAGAGRGALRRAALRRGAARRVVRFAIRFTLRLAERFAVFRFDIFLDIFLLEALRDFAAVFAVFRRFLAMRAP